MDKCRRTCRGTRALVVRAVVSEVEVRGHADKKRGNRLVDRKGPSKLAVVPVQWCLPFT